MLEGRVFLCGAGVGTPQLRSFGKLVDQVYDRLQLAPSAGELVAIKGGRPEEALGALSRRLADRDLMRRVVSELLSVPRPDLANHRTLIRLSRDLQNRVALITTNFDVLFERALDAETGPGTARRQSVAGQALP
ncbi:MAG TPA: hypothetical protein VM347_42225 [Nonomuraea sp.]|nr:hypothetical protein [Nonomuraea sp.]